MKNKLSVLASWDKEVESLVVKLLRGPLREDSSIFLDLVSTLDLSNPVPSKKTKYMVGKLEDLSINLMKVLR